jgi:hypothetical protein
MRPLFEDLVHRLNSEIGRCDVVSLPCCIHLFGEHDFAAVLPRKGHLEVRFALPYELDSPRVKRAVRISSTSHKHSLDLAAADDVDGQLLGWLGEAYHRDEG